MFVKYCLLNILLLMWLPSLPPFPKMPQVSPLSWQSLTAGIVLAFSALAVPAAAQSVIDLPAHSSTYSGNVRGYWFTAPKDFTITGVELPTDAGAGAQSIAVVRLAAEPPLYSATTNDFELLFLTQNDATVGMIPTDIVISAGDIVGVLGSRGGASSYGQGSYSSAIDGLPITLERLGMQFQLASTPPQELWTETGGSISRVILEYGPIVEPPVAAPVTIKDRPERKIKKKKKKKRLSDRSVRPPRSTSRPQ